MSDQPPPICFKFVDIYYTNKNANFHLCKSSGFRDMTLTNMGKRSFFTLTQHIKTIITLVLLGTESWLIALFKALRGRSQLSTFSYSYREY